jgi:hypothetical protein
MILDACFAQELQAHRQLKALAANSPIKLAFDTPCD